MATKITRDVLEGYLHCKTKAHLKLAAQQGSASDYEKLLVASRGKVRQTAIGKILERHPATELARAIPLTIAALRAGPSFVLDATLEDDLLSLGFDGLKRVDGPSKLGDFHYVPVLFHEGRLVRQEQRRLLEVYGLLLSRIQGRMPGYGVVWHGEECRTTKVPLSPDTRMAERLLRDLKQVEDAVPPRLVLNDHCQVCEFRGRCRQQAIREDNLSLLRGLGEKELSSYFRKGIFTLTQLAHTFRPRRKGKRVLRQTTHRYHALHALAIRDSRVYLFGTPKLADAPVWIYLDLEGLPDEGFVYLIGMTVVQGGSEEQFSYWADTKDQEQEIFERFLEQMDQYDHFRVFCYGGYERTFLKRMRKSAARKQPVDRVLDALVNVLSAVYSHAYFPCPSNGLKDVGGCLGCTWTEPEASGLQSIVWRKRWESSQPAEGKQQLLAYNREDCAALRTVSEFLFTVGSGPGRPSTPYPEGAGGLNVAWVDELDQLGAVNRRGKIEFFHPDYQYINNCAHFDYQRERVYVRTSKTLKKNRRKPRTHRNRKLRVRRRVQIVSRKCPACGSADIVRWTRGESGAGHWTAHKKAFDLVFTPGSIRRMVIECRASIHECRGCGKIFVPDRYERLAKHFHGLMSWAMFEHVVHQASYRTIREQFEEFFGLVVHESEIHHFKSLMAGYYRPCYKRLFAKVLSGPVLYVDETEVKLRTGKGYVWVFTTAEEVVYLYRPTREGDFLPELLKEFRGVLVSDFYSAYDGLSCLQQKCLIHLIRDMNQELLNNPFDAELQSITGPFGTLLRAAVEDIDRHGLKHRHLVRHERDVDKYFECLERQSFRSEAAEALRARLLKYREKLFTFLRHDGVSWNNNNAENAIRWFAYYREDTPGCLKEAGLRDYLVMLSLCQTCRYKGTSFLKFLLSRERDVAAFCQGPRRRRRRFMIETYPEGVKRPDYRPPRNEKRGQGLPDKPPD
jgi:predicted RecB family nuclease